MSIESVNTVPSMPDAEAAYPFEMLGLEEVSADLGDVALSSSIDMDSFNEELSADLEAELAAFAAELEAGELSVDDLENMDGLNPEAFQHEEEAGLNQYRQYAAQDNDVARGLVAAMEAEDPSLAQRAALQAQAQQQAMAMARPADAVTGRDAQVINFADRRSKKNKKNKNKRSYATDDNSAEEDRRAA